MNRSESIANIAKALASFHAEVKQPLKDKANPFFKSKYVPLENVVEAVTETASKHGLSFIQYPLNNENKVGIITVLMHESGEYIESEPIFATPAKQDAQATGSTITYLKRYSLSAMFGITSDEDDDGNSASGNKQGKQNNNYQQNTYNQAPPQQEPPVNPNAISGAQVKALKAKLGNINKATDIDQQTIYIDALRASKIPDTLGTKELSKVQATAVIGALAEKEKEFAAQ